ncbi:hypothetical protein P7K49_026407 [Saguinus oedipus]|uniref:Uncharacterized protein n=1 Tax=Saguinus oedipus TaxID=9490 RepID=A0ABQ9UD67_SAGOE|nr:hypothetical protein P7K49_026407 [Saguinus oedipus]
MNNCHYCDNPKLEMASAAQGPDSVVSQQGQLHRHVSCGWTSCWCPLATGPVTERENNQGLEVTFWEQHPSVPASTLSKEKGARMERGLPGNGFTPPQEAPIAQGSPGPTIAPFNHAESSPSPEQ